MTRNSSADEKPERDSSTYDDIVHVLQNTKITLQHSGSLQKFHHGKIGLAVEFQNNTE